MLKVSKTQRIFFCTRAEYKGLVDNGRGLKKQGGAPFQCESLRTYERGNNKGEHLEANKRGPMWGR